MAGAALLPAVADLALVAMVAAMLLAFVRLGLGPTHLDRVVAVDLMGILAVGIAAVHAIRTGQEVYLDVAIVMALIAFLGTIAMGRLLERRGRE
jgi:multicomponent Na+:H+ antiporter subunit F